MKFRYFVRAPSDAWCGNLSCFALRPVLKIDMSYSVVLKICWHNGKTIKWVCRANPVITEEQWLTKNPIDWISISVKPNKIYHIEGTLHAKHTVRLFWNLFLNIGSVHQSLLKKKKLKNSTHLVVWLIKKYFTFCMWSFGSWCGWSRRRLGKRLSCFYTFSGVCPGRYNEDVVLSWTALWQS